jgi:hypothetical protein
LTTITARRAHRPFHGAALGARFVVPSLVVQVRLAIQAPSIIMPISGGKFDPVLAGRPPSFAKGVGVARAVKHGVFWVLRDGVFRVRQLRGWNLQNVRGVIAHFGIGGRCFVQGHSVHR